MSRFSSNVILISYVFSLRIINEFENDHSNTELSVYVTAQFSKNHKDIKKNLTQMLL